MSEPLRERAGTPEDKEMVRTIYKLVRRTPRETELDRHIVITPYNGAYGLAGYVITVNGSPPRGTLLVPLKEERIVVFDNERSKALDCSSWQGHTRHQLRKKVFEYLIERGFERDDLS